MKKISIFDFDNTLYDYDTINLYALNFVIQELSCNFNIEVNVIKNKYDSINMMHVKDVAEALFKLINFGIEGIVNIASKNNYKIFQLISMIKNENLKKKIILKNENKIYFFKKIIVNKLRKVCFRERFNIQSEIERIIK